MTILRVAGLDPSLNNWGAVIGNLDVATSSVELAYRLLVETTSSKHKTVRKNSDDLSRARHISSRVHQFIQSADLIFVELPVGSQSARAMASYGICMGILSTINKPLIQVMPAEVKFAATGNKNATKNAMIAWAYEKYPDFDWFTKNTPEGVGLLNKNEHIADAIGSIYAGLQTDQDSQAKVFLTRRNENGNHVKAE